MKDIPGEIRERIEEEYRSGSITALMFLNGNAQLQTPEGIKGVIEAQKDMIAHTWLENNEFEKARFSLRIIEECIRLLELFGYGYPGQPREPGD